MNGNVLLVEDEPLMRQLIVDYLHGENITVIEAGNGEEALLRFAAEPVALVILDIMMPKLDGYSVCRSIRERSDVMIIMLTARSAEDDKLLGYDLGADDYMTKPFSPKELTAKVKALLKRAELLAAASAAASSAGDGSDAGAGVIALDGLMIKEASHEVKVDGEELTLSPKEYDLLLYMYRNRNIVLTRDMLLNHVWGFDYFGDARTVDTHIKRLRQKLGSKAELICTVRGNGYQFKVKR
ncbi:response regulator transcription factor [Paenibacillus sp. BC26]|uniref:response regulator transcription factor n=1 Tax=Paenibacillus sp. BC26 TaxID=1881032 RepID=UPI0008E26CD9|nr:response regulator transcription factor [Paenibacillus sp. BC26]SFT20402.1 DNA-binding response regulator, OmpR family, contains REC and winged-helix (wHTH) domain [Paenibacillus sp. BC26]